MLAYRPQASKGYQRVWEFPSLCMGPAGHPDTEHQTACISKPIEHASRRMTLGFCSTGYCAFCSTTSEAGVWLVSYLVCDLRCHHRQHRQRAYRRCHHHIVHDYSRGSDHKENAGIMAVILICKALIGWSWRSCFGRSRR